MAPTIPTALTIAGVDPSGGAGVLADVKAFSALGANGQNNSAMGGVMAAIAEALVATGVGLFVALPAVVAYNVIQKRIGEIETEALALTKLISAYLKAGTATRKSSVKADAALVARDDRQDSQGRIAVGAA